MGCSHRDRAFHRRRYFSCASMGKLVQDTAAGDILCDIVLSADEKFGDQTKTDENRRKG